MIRPKIKDKPVKIASGVAVVDCVFGKLALTIEDKGCLIDENGA